MRSHMGYQGQGVPQVRNFDHHYQPLAHSNVSRLCLLGSTPFSARVPQVPGERSCAGPVRPVRKNRQVGPGPPARALVLPSPDSESLPFLLLQRPRASCLLTPCEPGTGALSSGLTFGPALGDCPLVSITATPLSLVSSAPQRANAPDPRCSGSPGPSSGCPLPPHPILPRKYVFLGSQLGVWLESS